MADLTKFFDKKPTTSYTLGPSGIGIAQTGFNDPWFGWYESGVGVTYIKTSLYNNDHPTGYHASGSENVLFAKTFSMTFDSGANLWASFGNFNSVSVVQFSGNGFINKASFSGQYPVMFYNVCNNVPSNRNVYCFYLKSGQNKLYQRSNIDNFSGEYIVHQAFRAQTKTLNHVYRYPSHVNKIHVLGLYDNADGFELISDCFNDFNTLVTSDFEAFPSGSINTFGDFGCQPVLSVWSKDTFGYDNYELYPSGNISLLNSGTNITGYVWQ